MHVYIDMRRIVGVFICTACGKRIELERKPISL